MPAISTEKLLTALQSSGLLDQEVLEDVRRRVGKAPGKVDPRSVTKYLVQKKHLTVEQGLEFLDGRIPEPVNARPAPKKAPAKDDILLADDLEVVSDEDLEVVDDEDLEVVDEDLEVVDEEIDVIGESDLVEPPKSKKPAARTKAGQPARSKPAATGGSELASLDANALGDDLLGGANLNAALDAPATMGAVRRSGKPKKAKRENVWDSPLMLIGGGSLFLLIILGGALYWSIGRTSGDEMLRQAEEDYNNGSYTQAVHKFDAFLEQFHEHEGASKARVHRGLAYMRQVTEGSSNWVKSLDATQETLEEISSEKEFSQSRAELAALLPKIAEGLAEQARQKPDQELVDKTVEALALVEKYVPKSLRPGEQLKAVDNSLALTRLQLARGSSLAKALDDIKAALAAGTPVKAYDVRRELLRTYPDLEQDTALQEAILAVSQAEKKDVKKVVEARPATTEEPASPILATTTLVSRQPGKLPGVARMTFALAEGSAYGLDAATGQVKWRRHVGYDTNLVPRLPQRTGATDAILIDSVRKELVSVEATTGKLRWRHPLGETSDAEPLQLRNHLAVALNDGRLLFIDPATGNSPHFVKFPHKLSVTPAAGPGERRLYQLADHSNLYVLSADGGSCDEVLYLGHAPGSIRVPPLCVSRYVMIAENNGAKDSTLRVFLTNEDGLGLKLVQSVLLEGHILVPPQLASSNLLVLCTDRGAFYAYNIGGVDKKEPLTRAAIRPATDSASTLRFFLARGGEFWVADQQLVQFDIQTAQLRFAIKWTANVGDIFQQPLEEAGDALIHFRRKDGVPGVAVAAVKKSDGKPLWETQLAAPLAAPPMLTSQNTVIGMSLAGSGFQTPSDAASAIVETKPNDAKAIQPVGAGHGGVLLPDGTGVYLLGANAARLWVMPAAKPSEPQSMRLPFAAAAAPVVLDGNVLVPTVVGEVIVRNAVGSPALEPFQPKLASGTQLAWLRPTVTAAGDVILADGAQRLYRLVVDQQPRPHLALKATAELIQPIATTIGVAGQSVFAADSRGQLLSFALATLAPGQDWSLGGPVAQGPVTVGDCVLVATRNDQLYCFDEKPSQRWQTPLAYGPLAGDPILVNNKIVLASARGVVWSVNPADGQETGRVELGQPLATAPVLAGEHLIVAGPDGVLHRIAKP